MVSKRSPRNALIVNIKERENSSIDAINYVIALMVETLFNERITLIKSKSK